MKKPIKAGQFVLCNHINIRGIALLTSLDEPCCEVACILPGHPVQLFNVPFVDLRKFEWVNVDLDPNRPLTYKLRALNVEFWYENMPITLIAPSKHHGEVEVLVYNRQQGRVVFVSIEDIEFRLPSRDRTQAALPHNK